MGELGGKKNGDQKKREGGGVVKRVGVEIGEGAERGGGVNESFPLFFNIGTYLYRVGNTKKSLPIPTLPPGESFASFQHTVHVYFPTQLFLASIPPIAAFSNPAARFR